MRVAIFETAAQDVRYAVRALRASPGFTVVAVMLLALGIGANTAIFSIVSAVMLRPLPFPEPDRLVLLWDDFTSRGGPARVEPSPADYVAWKEQSESFSGVAALATTSYNLTGTGEPQKLAGVRVTGELFSILGMQPLLGRTLTAGDEGTDAPPVAVISERLWRSSFGADPAIVGRTITLNGLGHTVVGIVPPDFRFPNPDATIWVPARFTPTELTQNSSYYFYVVARLKAGVGLAQARAELDTIARRLPRRFPGATGTVPVTVVQLHEHLTHDARPALSVLLVAVAVVLIIACANLTNLLLARNARRNKELALRKVLGARHGRIARQLLTESAVLGVLGATIGVALAAAAFTYLARLVPDALPPQTRPVLDVRVLLFTASAALVVVFAIGIAPAFAGLRVGLDAALRASGGRSGTGVSRRVRNTLVIAEVTLTVVMLSAAGLLLRSYANVLNLDPGFRPENLLIAETVLPPARYNSPPRRTVFYASVLERINALPGVVKAGYVNFPPMVFKGGRAMVSVEGEAPPPTADLNRNMAIDRVASSGYFETLGVKRLRGRDFELDDVVGSPLVVMVNDAFVRRHWSDQDPIGRRVKLGPTSAPGPWFTVVGVIGNVRQVGLDAPAEPEVYFAASQVALDSPFLWPQYLVVRTKGDPLSLAGSVRRTVWSVDPDEPVASIRSMHQIVDRELSNRNTQLTLVTAFALLALLMAAIGLYGVLSYSVTQRTRDIGVRMALGARRSAVVGEIVRDAAVMTVTGVALGLGAAALATRGLSAWLFGVTATDPATFALAAVALGAVALAASAVPAFRGASVQPVSVLRSE